MMISLPNNLIPENNPTGSFSLREAEMIDLMVKGVTPRRFSGGYPAHEYFGCVPRAHLRLRCDTKRATINAGGED
jgi:hypothetical protein